jgi:hypothetical protein
MLFSMSWGGVCFLQWALFLSVCIFLCSSFWLSRDVQTTRPPGHAPFEWKCLPCCMFLVDKSGLLILFALFWNDNDDPVVNKFGFSLFICVFLVWMVIRSVSCCVRRSTRYYYTSVASTTHFVHHYYTLHRVPLDTYAVESSYCELQRKEKNHSIKWFQCKRVGLHTSYK